MELTTILKILNEINKPVINSEEMFDELCCFAEDTGWERIEDRKEGRLYKKNSPCPTPEKLRGIFPEPVNELLIPWPYEGYYDRLKRKNKINL